MDSKAVNKLIRSELWPLLRDQGFSKFESRTAFRYLGPFINVVNFQSFNSYLAASVGCTTFSFAINLGVYVVGSAREHYLKEDGNGLLRPREYDCSFRTSLKKRTPVDGFDREDIFYIDPSGHSVASCFHEVRHLLTEVAPQWFAAFNDLDGLLTRMDNPGDFATDLSNGHPLSLFPNRDSFVWHDLFATLRLLKHTESPTRRSAQEAFREIDGAIGRLLDFPTETAALRERYVLRIRELWERLGPFAPAPHDRVSTPLELSSLVSSSWAPLTMESGGAANGDGSVPTFSNRKQLWPILRNCGFSEFTDQLAHRVAEDLIEVVEIVPVGPTERKAWSLPNGLFRIGVGIFWPVLQDVGFFRTTRAGNPRPRTKECQLSDWIIPQGRKSPAARSAFDSAEEARNSLTGPAAQWFALFGTAESGQSILQQDDWELFWRFPMLQGSGAKRATRRLVLLAHYAVSLGRNADARECLLMAERAIEDWYPEHWKPRYRKWFDVVRGRLSGE